MDEGNIRRIMGTKLGLNKRAAIGAGIQQNLPGGGN